MSETEKAKRDVTECLEASPPLTLASWRDSWVSLRYAHGVVQDENVRLRAALAESEARRAEAERERDDTHRNCADANDIARMTGDRDAALARAQAAERSLSAAVEVLRAVEWRMSYESGMTTRRYCPVCGGWEDVGHGPACTLARSLATRGGGAA